MSRKPLCHNLAHIWRPVRGSSREVCTVCNTSFPCVGKGCGHADCHLARGEPMPAGVYLEGTYEP